MEAVLALLQEPRSAEWIAERLGGRKAQVKEWMERGVREGRMQKLKRPVRYVVPAPTLFAK
jgi:hypothetical protein